MVVPAAAPFVGRDYRRLFEEVGVGGALFGRGRRGEGGVIVDFVKNLFEHLLHLDCLICDVS